MLNTFDENNNEMLLAAIQELTADLATAQSKIAELEKGGGGGEVYIHITGYNESTNRPIYTILQRDPKFLEAILDEGKDYTDTALIYRVTIFTSTDSNIQAINYDGTLIVLNTTAKRIEIESCNLVVDADTGNYYILP